MGSEPLVHLTQPAEREDHDLVGQPQRRDYGPEAEVSRAALYSLILDLHDGLVQNLFAAFSQAHSLQRLVSEEESNSKAVEQGLHLISDLIEYSLQEIRSFIGAFGLEDSEEQDLQAVVESLAMQREDLTGMRIVVEVADGLPPVPMPAKIALYRILQEAFSNAHRHSRARRQHVRLFQDEGNLHLEIADDGQGFDPQALVGTPLRTGEHLGLRGMRDRVRMLGGTFQVESAPNQGTVIRVGIPV